MQACEGQHFALGTLALAVSMLDRFLLRTAVRQEDAWAVQLTAVACLSIAAKFEEVNLPYSVANFQVMANAGRHGRNICLASNLASVDGISSRSTCIGTCLSPRGPVNICWT